MRKYYPSKMSLFALRVIFFVFVVGIIVTSNIVIDEFFLLRDILCLSLVSIYVAIFFVYLPLYYKKATYIVGKNQIIINSGVFFLTQRIISCNSLVYATHLKPPLSRKFAWEFIIINALGGSLVLSLLSSKDAKEIYTFLTKLIESNNNLEGTK